MFSLGVGTRETTGAGVADVRLVDTIGIGSGGTLSGLGATFLEAREAEECAAVACMAFMRSALFCCFLGTPEDVVVAFRLADGSDKPSTSVVVSTCFLFESSFNDGSTIGQTKPDRGV